MINPVKTIPALPAFVANDKAAVDVIVPKFRFAEDVTVRLPPISPAPALKSEDVSMSTETFPGDFKCISPIPEIRVPEVLRMLPAELIVRSLLFVLILSLTVIFPDVV